MIPHILIYTDRLPENSNGCANAFIIRIRPSHKDDRGLLEHELIHVKQFWCHGLLIHSVLYRYNKRYRLKCEVEAYRKQLEYPHPKYGTGELWQMYAWWLAAPGWVEGYDLQDIVTKEEALALLS